MPSSEQLKNAGKEAGGVVVGAMGSAAVAWISGWLSERYSAADAEKLGDILKLYMVELNASTEPEHLTLDEQGYPKKKYVSNISSVNIGVARDNRAGPGQYFASSKLFIGTIGTYLDARYKRKIGAGKKGDILALVLIEWLDWANNHLPTLDYDSKSLKLLESRKRYLTKLISKAYFRHSSYWRRGTTKFDTLIKLQNILDGCIETCKQEEKKQSVRKFLSSCREVGVGILKESLTILYQLSDKEAHLNQFFAENFVTHGSHSFGNIANDEWNIYKRIRETENGKILNDTIQLGGLNTIGFPQQASQLNSHYYDQSLLSKKRNWKISDIVEYPWNRNETTLLIKQIEYFQQLGENILDFNAILKIFDLAYDVVGGKGDRWASKPAKELLLYALYDLNSTLQKLVDNLKIFINQQNDSRHKYNHRNSINPNDGWNPNFDFISESLEEIEKYKENIKSSVDAVGNIIKNFPISSEMLDLKEKQFSEEVKKRQGIAIPDNQPSNIKDDISFSENIILENNSQFESIEVWINQINNLRFPLLFTAKGFLVIDRPGLNVFKDDKVQFDALFAKERGIKNYNNWANNFVTLHEDFFKEYHAVLDQLKTCVLNRNAKKVNTLQSKLIVMHNTIKIEIDENRPRWKFIFGIIPTRLGKPFNRKAANFAKSFKADLEITFRSANLLTNQLISALKDMPAGNSRKESERSDYLLLMKSIQTLNLTASASIEKASNLVKQLVINKTEKVNVQHNLSTTLAVIEGSKPSVDESKEYSFSQSSSKDSNDCSGELTPIDMMSWIEDVYSQYLKWQKNQYKGNIQFFDDPASAITTLDSMIKNRESIDTDLREILLDPVFTLYKELDVCIKKLESSNDEDKHHNSEQLKIFSSLLYIVLYSTKDDEKNSIERFNKLCSETFTKSRAQSSIRISYSKHGLLRPGPNNNDQKEHIQHVSPNVVL